MNVNCIFLDIDGVLNNLGTEDTTPCGYVGIEQDLVANLKKIVDETNSIIVLTSDWKDCWSSQEKDGVYIDESLGKQGLSILDRTYDNNKKAHSGGYLSSRGKGILEYLQKNTDIKHWVVIDDNEFMDFNDVIMEHFVHTDEWNGLTDTDVKKAIEILSK